MKKKGIDNLLSSSLPLPLPLPLSSSSSSSSSPKEEQKTSIMTEPTRKVDQIILTESMLRSPEQVNLNSRTSDAVFDLYVSVLQHGIDKAKYDEFLEGTASIAGCHISTLAGQGQSVVSYDTLKRYYIVDSEGRICYGTGKQPRKRALIRNSEAYKTVVGAFRDLPSQQGVTVGALRTTLEVNHHVENGLIARFFSIPKNYPDTIQRQQNKEFQRRLNESESGREVAVDVGNIKKCRLVQKDGVNIYLPIPGGKENVCSRCLRRKDNGYCCTNHKEAGDRAADITAGEILPSEQHRHPLEVTTELASGKQEKRVGKRAAKEGKENHSGNTRRSSQRQSQIRGKKSQIKEQSAKQIAEHEAELERNGFRIDPIDEDGNCMYRALAEQLWGDGRGWKELKKLLFEYIRKKKNRKYFEMFLLEGEPMSRFLSRMEKDGRFGEDYELDLFMSAFVLKFNQTVNVHKVVGGLYAAVPDPATREEREGNEDMEDRNDIHLSLLNVADPDIVDHYRSVRKVTFEPLSSSPPPSMTAYDEDNVAKESARAESENDDDVPRKSTKTGAVRNEADYADGDTGDAGYYDDDDDDEDNAPESSTKNNDDEFAKDTSYDDDITKNKAVGGAKDAGYDDGNRESTKNNADGSAEDTGYDDDISKNKAVGGAEDAVHDEDRDSTKNKAVGGAEDAIYDDDDRKSKKSGSGENIIGGTGKDGDMGCQTDDEKNCGQPNGRGEDRESTKSGAEEKCYGSYGDAGYHTKSTKYDSSPGDEKRPEDENKPSYKTEPRNILKSRNVLSSPKTLAAKSPTASKVHFEHDSPISTSSPITTALMTPQTSRRALFASKTSVYKKKKNTHQTPRTALVERHLSMSARKVKSGQAEIRKKLRDNIKSRKAELKSIKAERKNIVQEFKNIIQESKNIIQDSKETIQLEKEEFDFIQEDKKDMDALEEEVDENIEAYNNASAVGKEEEFAEDYLQQLEEELEEDGLDDDSEDEDDDGEDVLQMAQNGFR